MSLYRLYEDTRAFLLERVRNRCNFYDKMSRTRIIFGGYLGEKSNEHHFAYFPNICFAF